MYPDPTMFGFCNSSDLKLRLSRKQLKQFTGEQGSGSPCTHLYAHRLRIDPVLISIVLSHVALCLGSDHSNVMSSVGVSATSNLTTVRGLEGLFWL